MPLTENDLKDLLAERANVPATRPERLTEVRHRIRRRKVARAVTAAAASATIVLLGVPALAGILEGRSSTGLSVVGSTSPSAPPSPPSPSSAPTPPQGKKFKVEIPDPTAPNTFPPAKYTIRPEGDGYRVTIPEIGDLEGLRQDLRELGVPAVVVPSPGYGDCDDNSAFPGANVAAPGVWEFVVRPGRFGADQQLAIWNNANSQGMLLIRTYCEVG